MKERWNTNKKQTKTIEASGFNKLGRNFIAREKDNLTIYASKYEFPITKLSQIPL